MEVDLQTSPTGRFCADDSVHRLSFIYQCTSGNLPDQVEWWLNQSSDSREALMVGTKIISASKPLLQFVSTLVIPASTTKFVAKDKFVVNTQRDAPLRISSLGVNFISWFLKAEGKIEDPIEEQTLLVAKLRKVAMDYHVIGEIGGLTKSEITLYEMFFILENQNWVQKCFHTGPGNLFYIQDNYDTLRMVRAYWHDGGWNISSECLSNASLYSGSQVYFRKSNQVLNEPSAPAQA